MGSGQPYLPTRPCSYFARRLGLKQKVLPALSSLRGKVSFRPEKWLFEEESYQLPAYSLNKTCTFL